MLIIVSIVMMTVDHRYNHLQIVRSVLATAIYPLQYLAQIPSATFDWVGENFSLRGSLMRENRELRKQHLLYQSRLQRLASLERENARLRQLLDSPAKPKADKLLIAELSAVNLHPFKQQVTLNKGSKNGVEIGQPIVGAKGIVGQIIEVFPYHSVAILISDPNHAVLVDVNRTGLRALLNGTGSVNKLELKFVSPSAHIRVGDLLTTSGLDGRYPAGYPVGEVVQVTQDPGAEFLSITVEPLADLTTAREVLILWTAPDAEQSAETSVDTEPKPE